MTGLSTIVVHPAAALFPLLADDELKALVESIRLHGYDPTKPVVLCGGAVLDGRNRLRAAEIAGVKPPTIDIGVERDPFLESWKHNGARRDLEPDHKAAIFLKLMDASKEWSGKRDEERRERERKANEARAAAAKARRGEDGRLQPSRPTSAGSRDPALVTSKSPPRAPESENDTPPPKRPEPPPKKPEPKREIDNLAAMGGVSTGTLKRVQQLQTKAPEKFEAVARGEEKAHRVLTEIKRAEKTQKIAEAAAPTALDALGRFPVLYVDPPWRYEHVETESRAIENQYPTMALDEICALKVADLATDDAILFCWATSPKLGEAFEVLKAWGFNYRTCMVWVKDQIGMGYYARQQHELLLIATRGAPPTPAPTDRPPSVLAAPRTKHSAKPPEFYGLIERMYPTLPRVELFCRSPRAGWAVWGNQAQGAK